LQIAVLTWVSLFGNHAVRIADIAKLRQWTTHPIAVKGIVHHDDAREAVAAGANGIVVSNHGGRQVDGSISALDALGPVADAVG
uniref:alpha-hydroxy-acid oxidizing protein n=1 Tax=Staphylococcus aureus TaxID=1280 RepID=UPI0038B378EA